MQKGMNKAQSAIEFVVIFSLVLFAFISFFAVLQRNISDRDHEKERVLLKETAISIRDEISIASSASDGYYREFKTPLNLMGEEYEIHIGDGHIYLNTSRDGISYKIKEVNGSVKKGLNVITKQNETVFLNP